MNFQTRVTAVLCAGIFAVSLQEMGGVSRVIPSAWAAPSRDHGSVLTALEGRLLLLSHESATVAGPSPRARFEGRYYTLQVPKAGDRVGNGDILRTLPGARARLVFGNGDQLNLAGGSAYRISWSAGKPPVLDLLQGGMRAAVEPGGPRVGLKIRTRAATMGVRGTEVFVEDLGWGVTARSKLTLIRGEAEVKPRIEGLRAPAAVRIQSGQTASLSVPEVQTAAAQPQQPKALTVVQPASTEEIQRARESVVVSSAARGAATAEGVPDESPAAVAVQKEIEALEKKAAQVVVADVKKHEPDLYQKLVSEAGGEEKIAELDPAVAAAVQEKGLIELQKTAPSRPEPAPSAAPPEAQKPSLRDLRDSEESPYETYQPKKEGN